MKRNKHTKTILLKTTPAFSITAAAALLPILLLGGLAGHCQRANTATGMPFERLPEGGYNLQ